MIWPEKRAKGRLFVCAVAPGSRGAILSRLAVLYDGG
jgi:hypothetical protein